MQRRREPHQATEKNDSGYRPGNHDNGKFRQDVSAEMLALCQQGQSIVSIPELDRDSLAGSSLS